MGEDWPVDWALLTELPEVERRSVLSREPRFTGGYDQFPLFSSFVIVFFPPDSLTENVTLSPACNVSNETPCTLYCSVAPPELAPTVPLCVC